MTRRTGNRYPLTTKSGGSFDVAADRILCNDVTFRGEYNPHTNRLWLLGAEFGPMGAVWAHSMQDAFDELIDADLGAGILVDEKDVTEESARLGNAGEPADLTYAWAEEVRLDPEKDLALIIAFAEARGAGADTLDDIR